MEVENTEVMSPSDMNSPPTTQEFRSKFGTEKYEEGHEHDPEPSPDSHRGQAHEKLLLQLERQTAVGSQCWSVHWLGSVLHNCGTKLQGCETIAAKIETSTANAPVQSKENFLNDI